MFEHGGFIVHFFDRRLIDRLATDFELVDVSHFTEGDLPRRLARVTTRVAERCARTTREESKLLIRLSNYRPWRDEVDGNVRRLKQRAGLLGTWPRRKI